MCGALSTVSGSTLCSAVLPDVFVDEAERAAASVQLGACAGVGVILGPMVGGALMAGGGGAPGCFGAAAALAALQLAMVSQAMPETLPPGPRRHAVDWANAVSPLAFTKLSKGGENATLRKLALILGLQCVPEGKNISDLNQIYLSEECGFAPAARTRWLVAFGLAMIAGGGVAKRLIAALGARDFTSLANDCGGVRAVGRRGRAVVDVVGAGAAHAQHGAARVSGLDRRGPCNGGRHGQGGVRCGLRQLARAGGGGRAAAVLARLRVGARRGAQRWRSLLGRRRGGAGGGGSTSEHFGRRPFQTTDKK